MVRRTGGNGQFRPDMDDPDAPAGTWNHWLLVDIPATAHSLAQGYKPGQLGVSGATSAAQDMEAPVRRRVTDRIAISSGFMLFGPPRSG